MPFAQTHEWFRVVTIAVAALSIYLGYRLFCDVSAQRNGRLSALITHLTSGALLALFGVGLLFADFSGERTTRNRSTARVAEKVGRRWLDAFA